MVLQKKRVEYTVFISVFTFFFCRCLKKMAQPCGCRQPLRKALISLDHSREPGKIEFEMHNCLMNGFAQKNS